MVALAAQEQRENHEVERKSSKKGKSSQTHCNISCLDGTVVKVSVDKSSKGEGLYSEAIDKLGITEKEYCGLMFTNDAGVKMWLDIHKDLKYQLGDAEPTFAFRVKFYEPEPARLQDEYMRYLLYVQLREDIVTGKLECGQQTYILLGSYTAQAELGNFNLSEHDHDYLDDYDFAPNQTEDLVKEIHDLHKEHRGQSPAQAELNFLEAAKKIPRYGMDVHNAKDSEGPVEIGISAIGVSIYKNEDRQYLFRWQVQDTILHSKRKFTVKLKKSEGIRDESDKKKKVQTSFVYHFDSAKLCKQCYKSCVEYHSFFRLSKPDAPRKRIDSLRLGSSFRYSDRTLFQLRHQPSTFADGRETPFERSPSKRNTPESGNKRKKEDEEKEPGFNESLEDLNPKKSKPNEAIGMELEETPIQYEEVDLNESNPDDEKLYDPKDWEVVEKPLPNGKKKRVRRRVLENKVYLMPSKEDESEETPVTYQFVPVDESEINEGKHDPKEWEVLEACQPDGSTKPICRRVILRKIIYKPSPEGVVEPPVMYDEKEFELDEPTDAYDPKEWEEIEKHDRDGSIKKVLRRVIITRLSPEDVKRSDGEPKGIEPIEVEEVEYDPKDNDRYDPREWEVVEKTDPEGNKKTNRRRIVISKVIYKPSEDRSEPPMSCDVVDVDPLNPQDENYDSKVWGKFEVPGPKTIRRKIVLNRIHPPPTRQENIIEEVPFEFQEVDVDEANPLDPQYDPKEWEVVEKLEPDGKKKRVRRRIVVQKIYYKPDDQVDEDPSPVSYEEVPLSEDLPLYFNPKEWHTVDLEQPDDSTKPFRRRIIIKKVFYKPSDNSVKEAPIKYEEVSLDGKKADDIVPDPNNWEEIEKKEPDGTTRKYLRRVILTRLSPKDIKTVNRDEPVKSLPVQHEDIEYDPFNPEDEKYDPREWELINSPQPDGTTKKLRRRLFIGKVVYNPVADEDDELPIIYEELPFSDKDDFDDKSWQVLNIKDSEGRTVPIRRRVIFNKIEPASSTPVEEEPVEFEEVDIDEANPGDYDPKEWEVVEKIAPNGRKKLVRRRMVIKMIMKPYESKQDEPLLDCIELPLDESQPDDPMFDPNDWVVDEVEQPDGNVVPVRRRVILNKIIYKPSSNNDSEPPIQYEEIEIDENKPLEDIVYNPKDYEIIEKTEPDGTPKKVLRRVIITRLYPKDIKTSDGQPLKALPLQYEDVEYNPSDMQDEKFDPKEWNIVEKTDPDGKKIKVLRRVIISKVVYKPSDDVTEQPLSYEEVPIDSADPQDDKYDPKVWEKLEVTAPDGKKKLIRRKIVIKRIESKPTQEAFEIPLDCNEVDVDESNPNDERFDPNEWETVEKILPNGTTKRVRRRIIKVIVKQPVEEAPVDYQEIHHDESKPECFDPEEWQTCEALQPGENKKRVERRSIIKKLIFKRMPDGNPLSPVEYEEIDKGEVEGEFTDPNDWEVIHKTLDDGTVKDVYRRAIITRLSQDDFGTRDGRDKLKAVPVQFEDIEYDPNDPQDEKYDPREWEVTAKILPYGEESKVRRRLVIKKVISNPNDDPDVPAIKYDEYEVTSPQINRLDPKTWEDLIYTADGKRKHVKRRLIVTKIIPSSSRKPTVPLLSDKTVPIEEEENEYEEIPIDESNPLDHDFDPEEWTVVEKQTPDGVVVRVRRRMKIRVGPPAIMTVTVHPKLATVTTKVNSEEGNEPELFVEEVPIIEGVPMDNYDPKEWEVVEKMEGDSPKKVLRRRVLSTASIRMTPRYMVNQPAKITLSTTSQEAEEVDQEEDDEEEEYEEVEVDEENPEDDKYDPEEWETFEKTLPDGTKKLFRRRVLVTYITTTRKIIVHPDGREEIIEESDPVETTEEVDEEPPIEYEEIPFDENNPENEKYDPDEWEIVCKPLPDGTKQYVRRRIKEQVITSVQRIIVHPDGREEIIDNDQEEGDRVGAVSPEIERDELTSSMDDILNEINDLSRSLDERDFELEEDDTKAKDEETRKRKIELNKKKLDEANMKEALKQVEMDTETPEERERRLSEEKRLRDDHNATITSIFTLPEEDLLDQRVPPLHDISKDFEFPAIDPTKISEIRPSSALLREKPKDTPPKPAVWRRSMGDEPKRIKKRGMTVPEIRHSIAHIDKKEDRKFSVDNVIPDRPSTPSGNEQDDYHRPNEGGPHSEILYTVKDVSTVEQGQGGFVQALKAKHEDIAKEEGERVRRSSKLFPAGDDTPKGHVPTRTVSFTEQDIPDITSTRTPPSIKAKPTIIVSSTPDTGEESVFQVSQLPVESHPESESDLNEGSDIPEVETKVVLFQEIPPEEDVRPAAPGSEPGVIDTHTVQIIPQVESQTIRTETIQSISPRVERKHSENCVVRTEELPTEVITKTITVEGDSSSLTPNELKRLLEQTGGNLGDDDESTVTQVLQTTTVQTVITGQTIIVEGEPDEEEIEKMIQQAVEMSEGEKVDDGTIVFTAVQKLDENGAVVESENGDTET